MLRGIPTAIALAACLSAFAADFHVSPTGRDDGPGTAARPFATLQRAQAAVRTLNHREPVTVWLHGGTYRLAAPLRFTPDDSGTLRAPVTYRAAPGERPVISGGRPVTGWRRQDDHLWVADVPWVKSLPQPFVQLFANGARRPRARTPNEGTYAYTKRLLMRDIECVGMIAREGDLQPWTADEDGVICLFHNWVNSYNRVGKADWPRGRLEFARPAGIFFLGHTVRYYVENLRSALDAPGEWFLDAPAGQLLYYPLPGEDLSKAEIIAPVVSQTLLELRGQADAGLYVEHLRFEGLSFQHTDAALGPDYLHSVQGAHTQRGAIVAVGARDCAITDCEFTHLGEHAVSLLQGCADNTIARCHMHELGGGGVYLSENYYAGPATWFATTRTTVDSNLIHDGGYIFRMGCGVFMGGAATYNRITHNEICDMSWIGIHQGWSWNSKDEPSSHHNEIAYNHIHHYGNGVLNDIGGIYTLGVSPGTVLHHNLIHDGTRYERGDLGYGGWGIYLDAGSSEIRVEDNVVYHTRDGGLHLHCDGWPYGNEIVNNVFAYATSAQLMRNNDKEPDTYHVHLERNIVYNGGPGMYWGGNWGEHSKFTADHNCYWSETTAEPDFWGKTFAQWQATGRDVNSLVADPGFVNAAAFDFRLKPDSPALKLGIHSIDLTGVGLQGPAAWRALPATLTHRAVEQAPPPEQETTLSWDFEDYEPGDVPTGAVAADRDTSVTVTDRDPAGGVRCLHLVDGEASAIWKPHWFARRTPRGGAVKIQCSVRNDAAKPVVFDLELRDWPAMAGAQYTTGPWVRFLPDGTVQAADGPSWKPIGTYRIGAWLRLTVEFAEGKDRPGTYSVTLGDDPAVSGLRFHQEGFVNCSWVGFAGMENKPGAFDVDEISVE